MLDPKMEKLIQEFVKEFAGLWKAGTKFGDNNHDTFDKKWTSKFNDYPWIINTFSSCFGNDKKTCLTMFQKLIKETANDVAKSNGKDDKDLEKLTMYGLALKYLSEELK